jgi:hypothetical protein
LQQFDFLYPKETKGVMVGPCGLALKTIVFRRTSVIKSLHLELRYIGIEPLSQIARLLSPTLSILSLDFSPQRIDGIFIHYLSSFLCDTLETFFSQCLWIRDLSLTSWHLGESELPGLNPQIIKDGIGRLTRLSIHLCGDTSLLFEHSNLENLTTFDFHSEDGGDEEDAIILSLLMNCRQKTELSIHSHFESTDIIPKVVKYYPLLEKLTFSAW